MRAVLVLAVIFTAIALSDGVAVMSVDLGAEFIKIAIVKPGVPMEIVLNKDSSRKTRGIIAFRDGERHFANQAYTTTNRFPRKGFWYLTHIIGRHFDDPQVQLYRDRFPYYDLIKDEDRGTVLFKVDEETTYSPEELLGMILESCREYAEAFADHPIKDAVITVPAYFNQAERRAIMSAAQMIGLNVLQLMSDNAAVALNYGVFRRKNFNSTMQYFVFYDMGATSTVATVAGYQVVKMKEGTRMETNPQVVIKGVGFDRTLGGLDISLRLRDHLAKVFNSQKKTKTDVFTNERAMAKLLKEADRVKQVLSANQDHYAQVEGLLDEQDFKAKVTREELEEMCSDLFTRVVKPLEDALKISEVTLGEVNDVILMGGGTRIPKIQEKLMNFLGRTELGKSINTDEAAAMGAVYQAAYLAKGFKVKTFGVKEGNIYPIVVEFEKHRTADDGTESSKTITRTLFGRMNPFPQKKVMTFNKHFSDFSFNVGYGDMSFLSELDKKSYRQWVLSSVALTGVEDAYKQHGEGSESKGIKAHFRMDESGILTLDKVESVFEKAAATEDEKKDESTWSKLGSAIGGLFGGSEDKDKDGKVEESQEVASNETETKGDEKKADDKKDEPKKQDEPEKKETTKEEDKPSEKTTEEEKPSEEEKQKETEKPEEPTEETKEEEGDEKPDEKGDEKTDDKTDGKYEEKSEKKDTKDDKKDKKDKKKDEKKKSKDGKKDDKDGKKEKDKDGEKKEEEPAKPKPVTIKEEINANFDILDLPDLSKDALKASKKKLAALKAKDKEKEDLEKAKNELEAYIFESQDKLYQDVYVKCSTEEERTKLGTTLSEASDWLYEQPDDAKKDVYIDKLKSLKDEMKDVSRRVYETEERPRALDALKGMLNHSEYFLVSVKNLTKMEDPIFTEVEAETLEKLINSTREWRDTNLKEQKKLKEHEEPKMLVEDIALKIQALDREVKYLVNKAKYWKPKTKPKTDTDKKKSNETTSDTDQASNETKAESESTEESKPAEEEGKGEKPETTESPESQEEAPPTVKVEKADDTSETDTKTEDKKEEEEEILQLGGSETVKDEHTEL